jgi:LPXTG-motif cell wall-anchored protein
VTVFSKSWRRPGALITVAAAGVLGVGLSAVPAAAHNPVWSVDCSSVTLKLASYGHDKDMANEVSVTADGKVLFSEKFGDSLTKTIPLDKHSAVLPVHLSIKAADAGYSKELDEKSPVCPGDEAPTTPAATAPTKTDTPVATPSATKSETPEAVDASSAAPSSSAAALPASQPSPAGDNLAETGSSSSTPVIAGGAAVVLVAGAGILWASRKRRAAQH